MRLKRLYADEIIVNILQKHYPMVAEEIDARINHMLPKASITDFSKMAGIINQYCQLVDFDSSCLKGRKITFKALNIRSEVIALLLLYYQPDKLVGLSQRKIRDGFIKNLSQILGSSISALANATSRVIFYYKTYRDFREKVESAHKSMNISACS